MEMIFDESGPETAPTIVFLHGGGGGAWMWQPVIVELADFHCLAPDLPEHGRSMGVKPFKIKYAAELTAELIQKHAHGGRAHVVGLSLGAQIGVALLSIAPDVVIDAVISSAILRPMPGANLGFYSAGVMKLSYWTAMAPLKGWNWWIKTNMKYAAGIPSQYFPQFKKDFIATTVDSWTDLMVDNMAFRKPDGLEKVTAPVLIVTGSKEVKAMQQSAEDLAASLPNGKHFKLTSPKDWTYREEHNWSMSAPVLFAKTVRTWIIGKALPEELKPART